MRSVFASFIALSVAGCSANLERPVQGDIRPIFSADDYPKRALRNREEGSVRVRLTVDETGKVKGCEILQSSDSKSIDDRTCEVIKERMQFEPALDKKGRPVTSTFSSPQIRWVLPDTENFAYAPSQEWTEYFPQLRAGQRVNFDFDSTGEIRRCWLEGVGVDGVQPCKDEADFGRKLYQHLALDLAHDGILTVLRGKGAASHQDTSGMSNRAATVDSEQIKQAALADGERLIGSSVPDDAELLERMIFYVLPAPGGGMNCLSAEEDHAPESHGMVLCAAAAFFDKAESGAEIRWEVIYRRPERDKDPSAAALEALASTASEE